MTKILTVTEIAANIEQSRRHIVKQDAIIARLTEQGRETMADEAKGMLIMMHEHLAFQIQMLERMQSETHKPEQLP